MVFELLGDYLFDKVNLLVSPGISTSTAVTSTTDFSGSLRVPDTSGGKYLKPTKPSRVRTVFYVSGGVEKADAYILTQCLLPSSTFPSPLTSTNPFKYYTGIKILAGVLYVVSKDGTSEITTQTNMVLTGNTTYKLEIVFNVSNTVVYIDDKYVGSITNDYTNSEVGVVTIYPIIGLIRSTDGSSVQMNFENYQFLQDR